MVTLYTNRPAFLNDIAEEIRLFLDAVEVLPAEDERAGAMQAGDALVEVNLNTGADPWRAVASVTLYEGAGQRTAAYSYSHPAVQGMRQRLHPVANSQDGHAAFQHIGRNVRRTSIVHAGRTAGKDESPGV